VREAIARPRPKQRQLLPEKTASTDAPA